MNGGVAATLSSDRERALRWGCLPALLADEMPRWLHQGDVMLPGTRAVVDVDPILISSGPGQLAALQTVLAALRQAAPLRAPATLIHETLNLKDNKLGDQLLPEVMPVPLCCNC